MVLDRPGSLGSWGMTGSLWPQKPPGAVGAGHCWDVLIAWIFRSPLKAWCHRSQVGPWEFPGATEASRYLGEPRTLGLWEAVGSHLKPQEFVCCWGGPGLGFTIKMGTLFFLP